MTWLQKTYQTYENNMGLAGNSNDKSPLCLLAHMLVNAQLEITLDIDGNFVQAVELEKASGKILVPVTEASAGRSSGIEPHALSDSLSYIAGDYSLYVKEEKEKKKAEDKFKAYVEALQKWCDSAYSNVKVKAILEYVLKKSMIKDLIKSDLVFLDEGVLSSKKIAGTAYEKCIVRFKVLSQDGTPDEVWQDKNILDAYTKYSLTNLKGEKDICYLTGEKGTIATNHPKGIVAAQYGAKLVSANDSYGFTYRGRFTKSEEAYALSYEATQKAHNALSWLVANQGVMIGTTDKRTFVCWNPEGKKVLGLLTNPFAADDDTEEIAHTNPEYRAKLYNKIMGYRNEIENNKDIVVMGMDAATTGRLSITYYNELVASDFYDRIENWYKSFNWYFTKFDSKRKPSREIRTPNIRSIIELAFGSEGDVDKESKFIKMIINDKLLKEQMQRLIKCMLDEQPIPKDIVHALVLKASNPQANTRGVHERILSTACAAIKKVYYDQERSRGNEKNIEKEDEMMILDENNTDRSYLFGRLLAVAEAVERNTYSETEEREPNAMRYQTAFVNHPLRVWMILENALKPYFMRLGSGKRIYYKKIIDSIFVLINEKDEKFLNKSLDEKYLLGYYLQRADIYTKKSETKNTDTN